MRGETEFLLLENFSHLWEHLEKSWGGSLLGGELPPRLFLNVQWAQIPLWNEEMSIGEKTASQPLRYDASKLLVLFQSASKEGYIKKNGKTGKGK